MGLFDKKYCDICGDKIGLLGNRKLEDGNLCKNCAHKLSPWFNERRHSSLENIKAQLAYREENKQRVTEFQVTRIIGDDWNVLFDENHKWFTVTKSSSPNVNENPDIVSYSAITGCRFDIDESKSEVYRQNSEGEKVSYNPPRYSYSYNFDFVINVNHPYFDEIKFRINGGTVTYEPALTLHVSLLGRSLTESGVNPENCPEYCKYRNMGDEITNEINRARGMDNIQSNTYVSQNMQQNFTNPTPVQTVTSWVCSCCGMQNSGKFCEGCGTPKPARSPTGCSKCNWTPVPDQGIPRFCPECGNRISE